MKFGTVGKAIARVLNIPVAAIAEVRWFAAVYWVRINGKRPRFVSKNAVSMAIAEACESSVFATMSGAGRLVRHSEAWAVYEAPASVSELLIVTLKVVFDGVFYNANDGVIGVRTAEIV
jgi:hypothetical protein